MLNFYAPIVLAYYGSHLYYCCVLCNQLQLWKWTTPVIHIYSTMLLCFAICLSSIHVTSWVPFPVLGALIKEQLISKPMGLTYLFVGIPDNFQAHRQGIQIITHFSHDDDKVSTVFRRSKKRMGVISYTGTGSHDALAPFLPDLCLILPLIPPLLILKV